ncbi:phosphoribosylglycinamide formyltransferase [Leptospira langatensis]|uniref:Phosphoribosylglycinamide formyltransferase n=1 Tax=Leptospira langatensis TaxID=2484983 RepID=A0A5F1ZP56_9LEPT|nr:phosphoribosylglycinamide formyltransferase [Leptospira langatensis]TGK05598.1 phosphoribosylglycinamide formyltransferase [Leptospira langatensis]TGL38794.1 phosphoribosylglycinamide formyltransferase [Leptospira langatensis]
MASLIPKNRKKLVFLASGRGSNFEAVLNCIRKGKIRGIPAFLVTDNPQAQAIQLASQYKVQSKVLDFKSFPKKEDYHTELLRTLIEISPDLIVACGYMRILKPEIIRAFPNRIINIHPSLLPAFTGLNAQKQALEYGVKVAGCTAHFVDEGVDSGPIILQGTVKIEEKMTERELTLAILKEEHKILPLAVGLFCDDRLSIKDRKVSIL